MSIASEKYLDSQSGKLIEELKKAYLAGQNIVYVVTKDYSIVKEALNSDPLFFLYSKPETEIAGSHTSTLGTKTQENKTMISQNLFYGIEHLKNANPSVPSMYIVTAKSKSDDLVADSLHEYLKLYVDNISGLSSRYSNQYFKKSMVVVVTPSRINIPVEISLYCRVICVEDPTINEIQEEITLLVKEYDGIDLAYVVGKTNYIYEITNLTKGLSINKISQIFSRIKSELDHVYIPSNDEKFKDIEKIISEEKAKLIENTAILKLIKTKKGINKTSGMGKLSLWLSLRKQTILKPIDCLAAAFISQPKGILLAGIPGTGKSLAAKTTASEFGNLPLLQLDMGNIMDKYQGESEHKMEDALKLTEAMSPCVLWIDEIEKGIAGASDSSGNSESMKRIFGKLLTWMQEKEERGVCCFVFATANSINSIPAELFRSGRFDEKFFTFLPTSRECAEIFKNQVSSQNKAYNDFCKNSGNQVRPLFDSDIMKGSFFLDILNSEEVLRKKMGVDDTRVSKENKFMTGSDIEAIIQQAKLIVYNEGGTSKDNSPVYNTINFRKAICKAIVETRTYGQTNTKQIVECFAQLSEYNFISVSDNEIVPFRFFDTSAENGQPLFDLKSNNAKAHLNNMSHEYDKQMFIYMGIAINQYLQKEKSNSVENETK